MLVTTDPETLDPRYVTEATGMRVSRLVHAGLVRLDPDTSAPVPYAAESWRWLDPLTLRIVLRSGLTFHSGAPFGPEDVITTLRAFASPKVNSRHARIVEAIADVQMDGNAVIIRLAHPHATLLADLELPILRRDQADSPPTNGALLDGLGPYAVTSWKDGAVELTPAKSGAAMTASHAVVVRTVHDENARALRLQTGAADVALNAISPTLLGEFAGTNVQTSARPGANLTYMVIKSDAGPLADVRVRRAVALAIDRPLLAATLLGGHATVADTLLPPGHWAYADPERGSTFQRDPTKARALLAEAGYPDGISLEMLTSTDRLRRSIARTIGQELEDANIHLSISPLELGTELARLNAGDFQLASLQLPELAEPNVLRVFLHSSSVPPNGANRGRVHDAALDALLDEGDRETDPDRRRTLYQKVDQRMAAELWWIPLWHEDQVALVSPRASTFVPSREGRMLSLSRIP